MADMFPVQKGVPLPKIDRTPKKPRRKYPVEDMAKGDMFFLPGRETKGVSAYIARITKNLTGKFSARHCWMVETAEGWTLMTENAVGAKEGTGVWRIE